MKIDLARYQKKPIDKKITICVSPTTKELWETLSKNNKFPVAKVAREFLEKTLPEIQEALTNDGNLKNKKAMV